MTAAERSVRCAQASRDVGEPLAGTAPEARTWLAIEQPGPWGRDAVTESHLGAELGRDLAARADGTGVRLALIRHPGRHADDHDAPRRRVAWLAHTAPGRTWMRRLDVADPRELLDLDLVTAGAGTRPSVGVDDPDPLLLVCANSKRDRCCAVAGRPLAAQLAATNSGRVWESSHLGGHRFAPTAVLLPHGLVHGRLDTVSAARVLATPSSGRIDLATLRGRSCWSGPGQAAEAHVRGELDLDGLDDIHDVVVTADPTAADAWSVVVLSAGGRSLEVRVVGVTDHDVLRPESCVKAAVPLQTFAVVRPAATR